MKSLLVITFATACIATDEDPPPPPPPHVGAVTPDTGAYGTEIVIAGTGFGAQGSLMFAGLDDTTQTSSVILSWSDTEIHARVPFPSTAGPILVTAPGGKTGTPAFTPVSTWTPGPSLSTNVIIEARSFGGVLAVLGIGRATDVEVAVFGAAQTVYKLDGVTASIDRRVPTRARLIADASGLPQVVANSNLGHLVVFTLDGAQATMFDTGVAGTLVAAGRDATGAYAWVATDDAMAGTHQLSRARAGAAGAPWQIDRGPITTQKLLDGQIAADGTLVVAYSLATGDFFDNTATLGVARLPPAATALTATEKPDVFSYDDYVASASLVLAADGNRMVATFSTQEYDSSTDAGHPAWLRGATGTWTAATGLQSGLPYAFTDTAIAIVDMTPAGFDIVADATMPSATEAVPLWPADPIALVVDGARLRPVVQIGDHTYFPAPPAGL